MGQKQNIYADCVIKIAFSNSKLMNVCMYVVCPLFVSILKYYIRKHIGKCETYTVTI